MTATPANSRPLALGEAKLSNIRIASPAASSLNSAAISSAEPRRAPVPRNISSPTPQYGHSYFDDDEDEDSWWKNVVREQIDVQALRDMARFLRTTEPPSLITRASIETQRDCFGAAVNTDNRRRWSLQSLRRANRKSHRGSGDELSLQFKLPDNAVPSTTLGGHDYVAISLPREMGLKDASQRNSIGLQLSSALPSLRSGDSSTTGSHPAWPRRVESLSSNGGSGPSTPTSSSFKARSLHMLKDELSVKEETDTSSATNVDDRLSLSVRDSSLRFYGTMLRLLGPSPVEEDESRVPPPPNDVTETEDTKTEDTKTTTAPTAEHSQPTQSPGSNQPEAPPALVRNAPSYSTIPKTSISPKSSLHRKAGLHSRAGSSATTASKSTLHAREKSYSLARPKSQSQDKPIQASPSPWQKQQTQSPLSPQREKTKPSSLDVSQSTRLHVPLQPAALMPGSPGFPAMLAAMSFPTPPETSPPTTSHGGVSPFGFQLHPSSKPSSPGPETPRATPVTSTTDHSEPATQDSRNSIASVTSVMTDATATDATSNATATTADVKEDDESYRSCLTHKTSTSQASMSILDKKRARWSLLNEKPSFASSNGEDTATSEHDKRMARLSRSSYASIETTSTNTISTSTSQAASALAERRAARRQKIKDKIQRDLTVSTTMKANKRNSSKDLGDLAAPPAGLFSDAVDSPVLGYFPSNGASSAHNRIVGHRVRLAQRSSISRLAPLPDSSEETEPNGDEEVVLGDIKQADEADASKKKEVSHDDDTITEEVQPSETPSAALCMSPIMVNASIEPDLPLNNPILSDSEVVSAMRTSPTPAPGKSDKKVRLADKQTLVPLKFSKAGLIDRAPSRLSTDATTNPDLVLKLRQSLTPILTSGNPAASSLLRPTSLPPVAKRSPDTQLDSNQTSPVSAPVGDTGASVLSTRDEQQWLHDHQRQSVQDWRQAAQRERERIQQLAAEEKSAAEARARKSPVGFKLAGQRAEISRRDSLLLRRRTTGGFDPAWSAVKVDADGGVTQDGDKTPVWQQPHMRSSSLTTRRRPSSIIASRRPEQDFDSTDRGPAKVRFNDDHSIMEQRVQRLERDRSDWIDVMVPLLENMNRLLGEMYQGNAAGGMNGERTAALRDSMHLIRSMGADLGKYSGFNMAEEPELLERDEEEDTETAHAH